LATEGAMKNEMKALRAKSPEPPIRFMIRDPMTCVELTLPNTSASIIPFIARQPRLSEKQRVKITNGSNTGEFSCQPSKRLPHLHQT
jgi:hypothetical protein